MSGSDYTIKHWQQRASLAEKRLEELQQHQQQPASPKPASPRVSELGLDMPTIPREFLAAINSTLGLSIQVCARLLCIRLLSVSFMLARRLTTCRVPQPPSPPFMISWWSLSGNLKCCILCIRQWLVCTRVPCPHLLIVTRIRPSPHPRPCRSRAGQRLRAPPKHSVWPCARAAHRFWIRVACH